MMLPRVIANYEGLGFVAAVDLCVLADAMSKSEDANRKASASSFVGLCKSLVGLTKEELWDMKGFVVILQPGQVLEIPAGWVPCQCQCQCILSYQLIMCVSHVISYLKQNCLRLSQTQTRNTLHNPDTGTYLGGCPDVDVSNEHLYVLDFAPACFSSHALGGPH